MAVTSPNDAFPKDRQVIILALYSHGGFSCRYPYEYDGGHIRGAVNVVMKEDMHKKYLDKPVITSSRQVYKNTDALLSGKLATFGQWNVFSLEHLRH